MATMASAARDIPTSRRDNLTAVAAWSVPVARGHPDPLPTPPNSISPGLPAHGLKAQLQKASRLEPIDSDLDLQDGQDDDHQHGPSPSGAVAVGSPPYDSAGAITPVMLARHHLPEILLAHGPLAIRHIMGYLTSSVPGFAGIPPAKARRLVVGALEGRGSGGEGGGLDGDVEFEKVGWGRWDARRRNQPPRDPAARQGTPPYGSAIPISKSGWGVNRSRLMSGSDEDSTAFSHDDRDLMMLENEADKMSMDGSASASCSEAPDDDIVMNDDPEDVTDDEDWAAVGAAALRASSYQAGPDGHSFSSNNVYTSGGGLRSTSGMARPPKFNLTTTAFGGPSGEEERAAVAALLQLGSM